MANQASLQGEKSLLLADNGLQGVEVMEVISEPWYTARLLKAWAGGLKNKAVKYRKGLNRT